MLSDGLRGLCERVIRPENFNLYEKTITFKIKLKSPPINASSILKAALCLDLTTQKKETENFKCAYRIFSSHSFSRPMTLPRLFPPPNPSQYYVLFSFLWPTKSNSRHPCPHKCGVMPWSVINLQGSTFFEKVCLPTPAATTVNVSLA